LEELSLRQYALLARPDPDARALEDLRLRYREQLDLLERERPERALLHGRARPQGDLQGMLGTGEALLDLLDVGGGLAVFLLRPATEGGLVHAALLDADVINPALRAF